MEEMAQNDRYNAQQHPRHTATVGLALAATTHNAILQFVFGRMCYTTVTKLISCLDLMDTKYFSSVLQRGASLAHWFSCLIFAAALTVFLAN